MAAQRDVLEIQLFGGVAMFFDGVQLPPLPSRHARLLFARLAMQAGRPQPRAVLAHMLWPDLPEARARRRLSHALWQIQDLTGDFAPPRPYLLTPGDSVLFDADAPYELDVEEFEDRLDQADAQGALDGTAVRHLRRCVELYHGDLLAGSYESWIIDEQERLRQRYLTALGLLVESCKQRGSFEEALAFARRLTHEAPLREDVHREVMRLCVLLGQQSQALAQFERCRSVLAEELGASPSAATLELHGQITRSRGAAVAPRPSMGQLVSRRLVARDDERNTLVDQLERTLSGAAGMVFVEGEPGIGKTELLAQAADDARWRGFTVLWGSCGGTDVPYSAFRDAIEPELDDVRVAQLRAHVEPVWLQQAGRLLTPLAGFTPRAQDGAATIGLPKLDGSDGAERMREALTQVVAGLAVIEPVVLILEDAHRADADSLALLRALARRPDSGRLLVVLTFRDVDARADDAVWAGLRAVDRDARPVRLRLEPLSPFETAGLLREVLGTAHVPAGFAESVHREGGGNPLYVLELLRALRDDGALGTVGDELDSLPVPVTDGLRTLIADRLGHLDASATAVVQLGAVLGAEFMLSTLEAGSGLDDVPLAHALGELSRRNLLEVEGERCRFAHAVTRRVVLEQLSPDAAAMLHVTAADALERTRPDQVEALAAHLRAAGEPRRALRYLRLAAARADELHAYATAATHLLAAREVAQRTLVAVGEHTEILLALEQVLDVLGRRDEQASTLAELAALAEGDHDRTVEVSLRRAGYLALVDRFDEAQRVAAEAVSLTEGSEPSLRGRALTAHGRVLHWIGDNERAADALIRAVELLPAGGDAVRARVILGSALRALQRFDEAEQVVTEALAVAERSTDEVGIVQALVGLADLRAETGRTQDAVAAHRRAVALARQIGFRHREGVGQVNLGTVLLTRGEPGPALTAYDGAEEVFRSLGNSRGVAMVQLNRAWLQHRWLGRGDDAIRDATAAHTYFHELGSRGLVAVCLETLAGIARERGDLATAERHLDEGLAFAREVNDQRAEVQILRGHVELALAGGHPEQARTLADGALAIARALGLEEFVADLASLSALAAGPAGATAEVVDATRRLAVEHLGTSAEQHRIHHRLAQLADADGSADAAREHRMAAHRLLLASVAGVEDDVLRSVLEDVTEHRAIVAAGAVFAPRTVELQMARIDAPRGRALVPDELVAIALEIDPTVQQPAARRSLLLQVLDTVQQQGAQATVEDLAAALDVSASTVRRDLRHLRTQGHVPTTRGTGTG